MKKNILFILLLLSTSTQAHVASQNPNTTKAVYADLQLLKTSHIPILYSDPQTGLGYAIINGQMEMRLSELAHKLGRCGNYEALSEIPQNINSVKADFIKLTQIQNKNLSYMSVANRDLFIQENPSIIQALQSLKSENIRETVTWLSNYPTRYNRGSQANVHVNAFYEKLKLLISELKYPAQVDLINHRSTPQKSIRVSLKGSKRPNEVLVFGAHLDSINGWGGTGKAPGADDNASGSASLLEALRVALVQPQTERTLDFFWYAGEESGLLGSAEIAENYKLEKKNVISALQLDMTLFPGDGEFRITSISDFTSPWLRDYLKAANSTYLNIEILDDKCGYGCSDHASWYRRGFPTVFPTEAKFNSMFDQIHTERDVITPTMSFEHALVFSKIALIFALDLGNSNQREPIF